MLELYLQGREAQEAFAAFVARVGIAGLRIHLEDLARIPMPEQGPEFYRDLGTTKDFAVEAKEGECHA